MMMHEKIRLFWEQQGYTIHVQKNSDLRWTNVPKFYINLKSKSHKYTQVIACPFGKDQLSYYINDRWYDEATALKVIALCSFV